MNTADTKLKDFFVEELQALREDATEFGRNFPAAGRALDLGRGVSADPQVELLLQSFAYLSGRLRYQVETGLADVPNFLTSYLYPHLSAPIPSMLIASIDVKPDGANFTRETVLERGRYFTVTARNNAQDQFKCRFRTPCDTQLLPLLITKIELLAQDEFPADLQGKNPTSILRVRVQRQCNESVKTLNRRRMRFHIKSDSMDAFRIYEWFALNRYETGQNPIGVCGDGDTSTIQYLPAEGFRWVGFGDDEALFGDTLNTHPGFRLLQEYFSFPEKFFFFDLENLPLDQARDSFDLLFFSDAAVDKTLEIRQDSLLLNCVPLVNLYSQRLEPFQLDQTQYEYQLMGDMRFHRFCEIHTITELTSTRPGGVPRPIAPYFSLNDFENDDALDYFYIARRSENPSGAVPGTETHVSFLDTQFTRDQTVDEVVGGTALCTNRWLPEQLRIDDSLRVEGAAPIVATTIISKPTPHQTPRLIGEHPWALASQLALNHLSLADGPQALGALKDILRTHVPAKNQEAQRQINGLLELKCTRVRHHRGTDAWRGFVPGLCIKLEVDHSQFGSGSAVLFGEILHHFFTLYAPINMTVELALSTSDVKGILKEWPPILGTQNLL
ncbi:type VI secretion system baseplate subunit TssF [Andreprevotia chitinilytica]|uniref:type VI secretion system baseplate subunit TssF n=1 Tax=Andreprevotia chitinilytica TaxID=396808 RepID=UPI000556C768|nr:type VI secretion system baseplate subunit TssF [Andreprevotia chitinilytica]